MECNIGLSNLVVLDLELILLFEIFPSFLQIFTAFFVTLGGYYEDVLVSVRISVGI